MALASSTATPRTTSSLPTPPMLDGGLPFIGHALDLRRNPVELLQRGRDRYGDLFTLRLPGSPSTVVMTGPKAQQKFFRLRDSEMSMREVYKLMIPIFGKGIAYDAEPEIMKEQLGFFHEALRESRLRTYAQGFVEEAEDFFGKWGDEGVVDLYETGNELTIYTSSRSLLGRSFRESLSDEFAKLYYDMEGGLNLLAFFAPHLPIPAFRKRDRARKRLGELISTIVADRRAKGLKEEDFLQTVMEATYSNGRSPTEDEMTGLLLAIMFAGHHTSGITFAWTGILLAQHPQWIERLRAEQGRVLGDKSTLELDDLRGMTELEWVVKETLRLYPPIILVMRRMLEGFDFGGYHVPKDSMVMASPAVGHRIPEVFTNPNRFEPDRFGPEREEDRKHPMSWISFGGGRHRCMGIVFAQLQLRAIWSHLLRNFDFELIEPRYEPSYDRMLVGPRSPCRARYRRRKTKTTVAVPG
ncbi:MAG: cytochrome P450 [Myxococcales bacterium]|nr:cytochrome P450 [Myxococcales bacterium]MCB9716388.1 cytochrome P450 [Myxococcales bacterium]